MARRMKVWCNGVSLTDAVPSAIIRGIYEDNPENDLMTGERPGQPGQWVIYNKRTQLTVRIEIVIREVFDLEARARALQAVCVWAQNGILELSNRPDQQLNCVVIQRPALGADRDYTQTFSIEFAAISCPYWQSRFEDIASTTGTTGEVVFNPAGSLETPLMFTVTPSADTLTAFSATCNGATLSFSGLDIGAGETLELYYDENALQWIKADGVSALGKRNANSDDDIFIKPGTTNTISFTANTACSVTFKARGRYY